MKNQLWLLLALLLTMIHVQGQNVTKSFTWQGIIKDSAGQPLDSQIIDIRLGIRSGTTTGTLVYREIHQATTSSTGHIMLEIGNGQATDGTFDAIDWTANNYFQEVEIDTVGNGNFQTIGTTPIRPIPLAIDVLNKNKHVKILNANNYQTIDLEKEDKVYVEGNINITDTYEKLDFERLDIYNGNFTGTGTTGNGELNFGSRTTIKSSQFSDIKLQGDGISFENCHFSGDIQFPYGATLFNCVLSGVTMSSSTSLERIQSSIIENSTLPRIKETFNNKIENSNIQSCYLSNNRINSSTCSFNRTHVSITANFFKGSKIHITNQGFPTALISDNIFDGSSSDEVIKIDVNHVLSLYQILNNVFKHTSPIRISGNTSTSSVLGISNNMFYGGHADESIIYNSNIKGVISNNKLLSTDLGVEDNNDNLRVFDNIHFRH